MPKGTPKEKPIPRTMRVERRWQTNRFVYYRVYSDGLEEPTTRREAEKYKRAYDEEIRTIVPSRYR